MQVVQYQVSPQATIANDVPQHYVPPPPYFASVGCQGNSVCRRRKYAWWCCGCGALAAALGGLLAAQHILLRAYTASPHHLETVPAAVPAAMLVLTGVCIMSLARRRNRYSYMIKVVGACCLVCALTCVLVTITTTVIHMNKLQTLKFCEYTKLTRTCTCFSISPDVQHSSSDDDGSRCVFEGVSDCGVVHGALYWCLRGVFALSVSAVLVCIFSCMLAYQLLSHERKKMYWEQLELRCRSLYRPPSGQPAVAAGRQVQNACSCCAQCAAPPAWDFTLQHRFWAPGRIGNLYSPNPGTGRKTSPWSWFPWPRGNSQNSRCRMSGVPQSGDSAYGFCETEQNQPGQSYEERPYPTNFDQFQRQNFPQNTPAFSPNTPNFPQTQNFAQNSVNFGQSSNFQGYPQGAGFQAPGLSAREAGGSFDAQTGVWGPPPPYSPQGRSASRHHLHQDPATTTLLHHHIDPRTIHDHPIHDHPLHDHTIQHTCRNYHPQDITRINPEISRMNPDLNRLNPDINRIKPDINRLNPDINRLNPDINRMNPELMYPNDPNDMRLQDMVSVERFNTLRGHLVKYRGCPRSGVSAGNIHADCGEIAIECLHQKSASKVSDQSSDSCQKQGKENLGFQNDKHSPIRSSARSGHGAVGAESEVYFADVSSCCTGSVQADCCINPNVSLVGTIETHPESTSESDTGSFTLTRQQRPQPQVGSKRRPRQTDKHTKTQEKIRQDFNNSIRLTEQQIEHLNSSMRMERMNEARMSERMNESRISERMNESRISDRMNESRISDRMNESRISDRMADTRMSDRMIGSRDRLNDSRIERINESRDSRDSRDRLNERERMTERIIESDRSNDSRIDRNDSRDRLSDSRCIDRDRLNDRINDARTVSDRERMIDSRAISDRDRINDSRVISERDRLSDSRFEDRRLSDLNSSIRIENSPKRTQISPLRMPRTSPKERSDSKEFFIQNRQDSKEFFPQNISPLSPLSPNTEESLLSSEGDRREETVYSNEPEASKSSKCLAPDSQYEPVREQEEILKLNHHHCYSDTNTMDSGWQSGSEKQVTD